MAVYSVCTLNIETDASFGRSYQPFILPDENRPEHIDMTVRQANGPHSIQDLHKAAELPDMTVWENKDPKETAFRWVFILKNGLGSMAADADYRNVEYYASEAFSFLGKDWIGNWITPFFSLILRCRLILEGFTVLHSACVELDGKAYAFTGPSGIGKSSRAAKWCELFSAQWISGDRPAICVAGAAAYGVPWDGKEGVYRNTDCPLAAILKVTRSESEQVNEMTEEEKLRLLCEQAFIPMWDARLAAGSMSLLKHLTNRVPVYDFCCGISDASIYRAKGILSEKLKGWKGETL